MAARRTSPALALLAAALVGGCTGIPTPASPPVPPSTAPGGSTAPPASDPAGTGEVTAAGPMVVARAAHTATVLRDGRVLVAGGCTRSGCEGPEDARRAEVFDPVSGLFSAAAEIGTARVGHTATEIPGGRVLLAGGYLGEGTPPLATAEVYDPAAGFVRTGSMSWGRGGHVAAPLPGGRVLVAGGQDDSGRVSESAEIFDPVGGVFRPVARMGRPRSAATATALRDGRVLVVGGQSSVGVVVDTAEVYDPVRDEWSPAGRMAVARNKHGTVLLPGGDVLVVGGSSSDSFTDRLDSCEVWSLRDRRFRPGPTTTDPLFKLPAALVALADGRVLVGGGGDTVQLVDPRRGLVRQLAALPREAFFATATRLADGRVLLTGGYDGGIVPSDAAFLVRVR